MQVKTQAMQKALKNMNAVQIPFKSFKDDVTTK